jgi:lipoyl-dependent peroxiredoxin
MTEKLLFTGKTHNTNGAAGGARSSDCRLDIRLAEPHPAAEQLFGVERTQAQALVDIAHTICPYSKAVHGNIDVTTTLV